ncbi:hypothetical protein HK100_002451 [Physocladia obscura]|uniref:Uncharacterized protein n=1 Tax=Physocladia obscura TaxID=109957 RepID=A0AAD5XDU6_9FUNG|nr:hypothetical protein HK100_002451 [Physocladia obscura]
MDKWSDEQQKRMQLGGNAKALAFFKQHPAWREGMSISEKYNSEFARLYKDKLSAECEGRPWKMPDPSQLQQQQQAKMFQKTTPQQQSSQLQGYQEMGGSGGNSFRVNDNYFASKGAENQNRPTNLPPSQGGKYAGFGSTPTPAPQSDLLTDPLQTLSLGWSMFSSTVAKATSVAVSGAEQLGQTLTENVIKPTTTALRDPNLSNNLSSTLNTFGHVVVEGGNKGLSFVKSVVSDGAASTGFNGFNNPDDDWSDLLHKAEALKKERSSAPTYQKSNQNNDGFGGFDSPRPKSPTNVPKNAGIGFGGFGGFDEFEEKRKTDAWSNNVEESRKKEEVDPVHHDGHQKKSDWDTDETWEEF